MADFATATGLQSLFRDLGLNPEQNFEDIFSDLWDRNEKNAVEKIEAAVQDYFNGLELPDEPTIYDHLVLSLRSQDIIATFNWDPLLMQACLRNGAIGLSMPRLTFLHGNLRIAYCPKDRVSGVAGNRCRHCSEIYTSVPLLYPIKKKDYSSHNFIEDEWKVLKWGFTNAFMITIFGYSGPRTDQEALAAMEGAWGDKSKRAMEQIALIVGPTDTNEDRLREHWNQFIHTHHYEIHTDFYDSWIANHPRRTGEAYRNQYLDAKFIENNPIPRNLGFPDLWNWYERFRDPES